MVAMVNRGGVIHLIGNDLVLVNTDPDSPAIKT